MLNWVIRPINVFIVFGILITLSTVMAVAVEGVSGNSEVHLQVGDQDRSFWFYVPSSIDSSKPAPLLIEFPGGKGFTKLGQDRFHVFSKANQEGFIVAYAEPSEECGGWAAYMNVSPALTPQGSMSNRKCWADDAAYVRQLIAYMKNNYSIDANQIFLSGFSSGGLLAYRLAVELSDQVTGVAIMSGAFSWRNEYPITDIPAAARPVSIIAFHGDADNHVSYEHSSNMNITLFSAHESMGYWVKNNDCRAEPEKQTFMMGGSDVILEKWDCKSPGTAVELYTKSGGGHGIPGYANSIMWKFFMDQVKERRQSVSM